MTTETDDLLDDDLDQVVETKTEDTPPPNDDLRSAITELAGIVKQTQAPKPKEEAPLTQEQKDELWGVYNPEKTRPDFFAKFFNIADPTDELTLKEKKELWAEMQKGLVGQSIVGARNLIQMELAKIREEMSPLNEYVSKSRARELKSNFDSSYPALADKRFDKVLRATAQALSSQQFASEDEYFKALAEGAAETIKGVLPEFDLGAVKPQTKQSAGTTPRLPRTGASGTGGAGVGKALAAVAKGDATSEFLED